MIRWNWAKPYSFNFRASSRFKTPQATANGPADGNDYARAARTPDGRLAIIYAPMIRPLSIDPPDQANGAYSAIGGSPFANTASRSFKPPGNNHDGNGNWVLVLEVI